MDRYDLVYSSKLVDSPTLPDKIKEFITNRKSKETNIALATVVKVLQINQADVSLSDKILLPAEGWGISDKPVWLEDLFVNLTISKKISAVYGPTLLICEKEDVNKPSYTVLEYDYQIIIFILS